MSASAPPHADDLRGRVLRGIAWKAASQIFRQGTRLAVVVILARLLTPSDYGIAAMVLVFASLVIIFADVALGAALVQRTDLTEADRSTVFWTSAAIGVVFTVLGFAFAGPIAAFYGEPEVEPLFRAFSLSFLVTALGTTQTALLNRDMNFRSLELRLMAGSVVGGIVGIALALEGYGAWALIGQQLVIGVVSTTLLWVFSPWRPSLTFSMASLRRLGGFSGNVFGTRILFFFNRNLDNVLIGRFLGASALGAYAVAYNVMLAPLSRIAQPIVEVLFPAFSRIQRDKPRMASAWLRGNRLVASITIPSMLGLIVVAPEFVAVVLGERWNAAVPVIQVLAWVGLLQSLQRFNSIILMALDRTSTLLRYSIVVLAGSVAAFVGGLPWGIVGVATGYAISSTILEPYYSWLTARALEIRFRDVVGSLAGVAQASLLMLVCVLLAKLVLVPEDLPAGARLAIFVAVGVVVYVPAWALLVPDAFAEVRRIGRRRGPKPVGPPQPAER